MQTSTLAPPPEAPCLYRPYPSSQKGGTLIATDVVDLATHQARMRSPDGYRPSRCPTCGHPVMHAHDTRSRQCQLDGAPPQVGIARHRCAHAACGAQWQTLPSFLARHLHFAWSRIQAGCEGRRAHGGHAPSARTVCRWRSRLASSASRLLRLIADGGRRVHAAVQTRGELVEALGVSLSEAAAWVHQLLPGARLM